MTLKQKLLLLACGIIAAYLFIWPLSLLLLWFFAEVNHGIPTLPEEKKG